jgi:hypothetical protein
MQRTLRTTAAIVLALGVAACADLPTSSPYGTATLRRGPGAAAITPGTCTNLSGLYALAAPLFGPNTNPNIQSVRSKLKSLDRDVKAGNITEAQARAYEIVQFTLKKNNQGGLSGGAAEVKAFTDAVFCFAGIDLNPLPDNTFLILPSDQPQTVTNLGGSAGIAFDANPVAEPTLIEIATLSEAPLVTKLDQYPGFISITKTSATGAPLTKPAVVGVCADGVIPQDVRDRLRLGHGKATGFEIAAPGDASFLTCPNEVADASQPLWKRLANKLLPQQLHASMRIGGGIGGTVTEFSPFAPVDPQLSFGGGVGGTVTEFIRVPQATVTGPILQSVVDPCAAPLAGKLLPSECLPFVRITTRLGTLLTGVPVQWAVTAGGGVVAPLTGFCGTYGSTAATTTDANAKAGVCWKMGAPGVNTVTATPSAGGDAPAGVTFVPATNEFSYTAVVGPPAQVHIESGDGQTGAAGSALGAPLVVRITDDEGYVVPGATVYWQIIEGGGSLAPTSSVTGPGGLASTNWTLGSAGANRAKAYITSHVFAYNYFNATATP